MNEDKKSVWANVDFSAQPYGGYIRTDSLNILKMSKSFIDICMYGDPEGFYGPYPNYEPSVLRHCDPRKGVERKIYPRTVIPVFVSG